MPSGVRKRFCPNANVGADSVWHSSATESESPHASQGQLPRGYSRKPGALEGVEKCEPSVWAFWKIFWENRNIFRDRGDVVA